MPWGGGLEGGWICCAGRGALQASTYFLHFLKSEVQRKVGSFSSWQSCWGGRSIALHKQQEYSLFLASANGCKCYKGGGVNEKHIRISVKLCLCWLSLKTCEEGGRGELWGSLWRILNGAGTKKTISIFIDTFQLHNKSKQKTSLQLARGGVHSQLWSATADHQVILQCLGCKIAAGASVCRLKQAAPEPPGHPARPVRTKTSWPTPWFSCEGARERNHLRGTEWRWQVHGSVPLRDVRSSSHRDKHHTGFGVHEFTTLSLSRRVSFCATWSEVSPFPLKVR